MLTRRNIIIAVSTIVFFAAMVGFFITFWVSAQIAFARAFIDAGLIIALVAAIMAVYKEPDLKTHNLMRALSDLKDGKYDTNLKMNSSEPLFEISQAINDLAKKLHENHEKQEAIKRDLRNELLPIKKQNTQTAPLDHSHHPELGPVKAISNILAKEKPQVTIIEKQNENQTNETHDEAKELTNNETLNNTLIQSKPPYKEEQLINNNQDTTEKTEQDLGELYSRFTTLQQEYDIEKVDYTEFLSIIERTKDTLLKSHECKDVYFEVVNNDKQVALQPRIIRH